MVEAAGATGPARASATDALGAAHARLLADRRFQFDFPAYVRPPTPGWLRWLERLLRDFAHLTGPHAKLLAWSFWVVVALLALGLLVLTARALARRPTGALRPGTTALESGGWGPSRDRAQALLSEADRLAEEGRFGDAVRVLLFRTLDDLDRQKPGLLSPAQTSREIAALPLLPEPARQALSAIARAVERFTFAARPVDAETFAACRADYTRWAQAAAA
ncbi:MAG: DUF4129 domain-containing protein [Caulobacteraceae bacterium]|nr:DUF4129 domain-containing protein [Caulobacter sp.]